MSKKNRKQKKSKNKSPKESEAISGNIQISQDKGKKTTFVSVFFRSSIVAAFFALGFWYVLVVDFYDLNEVQRIVAKINAQDTSVTSDERTMAINSQTYFASKNYEWFHSYKWLYNTHLLQNYKNIIELDTLCQEDIQASKSGTSYQYLRYCIIDKTPEDAIILMPDKEDLVLPEGAPDNALEFPDLKRKAWCYYFVYPRQLVYDEYEGLDSLEGHKNYYQNCDYEELRKKVTHVAIVNGRGYEHLNYIPRRREAHVVLPINDSNAQQKPVVPSNTR